jgi:hypothetical protein
MKCNGFNKPGQWSKFRSMVLISGYKEYLMSIKCTKISKYETISQQKLCTMNILGSGKINNGFLLCKLNTVKSPLSGMHVEWGVPLHKSWWLHQKNYQKPSTKSEQVCFNSCVVVFLSDIMGLWAKDFTYIYCTVITNSVSVYCNGTFAREDDGQCC